MASLIVRPGIRVRLKGQADHVPDFYVVRLDRDQCWIRQQGWNPEALLHVPFTHLLIPADTLHQEVAPQVVVAGGGVARLEPALPLAPVPPLPQPPNNVIYMDAYRRKKAR
jgi:hypothetical protein